MSTIDQTQITENPPAKDRRSSHRATPPTSINRIPVANWTSSSSGLVYESSKLNTFGRGRIFSTRRATEKNQRSRRYWQTQCKFTKLSRTL